MKKIVLKLLVILLVFGVNSCSNEDNVNSLKSPEYGKDVTLIAIDDNQLNPDGESKVSDDASKVLIVKLGRKSKNCFKFGICEVCAFCGEARVDAGNNIEVPVNEDNSGEYIELHLGNDLGDEFDSNIYIDEDLYDENSGELLFSQGVYSIDDSLGSFGGYRIAL